MGLVSSAVSTFSKANKVRGTAPKRRRPNLNELIMDEYRYPNFEPSVAYRGVRAGAVAKVKGTNTSRVYRGDAVDRGVAALRTKARAAQAGTTVKAPPSGGAWRAASDDPRGRTKAIARREELARKKSAKARKRSGL
jgi:hypothetical protein